MVAYITYSPAYTIVPTYECFNRCSYCNFRVSPGEDNWLGLKEAEVQLTQIDAIEILILSGEVHPESVKRSAWFQRIYDLCQLALSMDFLPHTNAGPLSFDEMEKLRQVNVSMGLMLEQLTPTLLNGVHRHAPSKLPKVRLQQLEWAGQLKIPFTTGLLLGIGETEADWEETLHAIASIHATYGHIQEVILQPHQPGEHQLQLGPPCDDAMLIAAVTRAREILPPDITVQIPPNLVRSPETILACVQSGARDLGGIGPRDEVNPNYHHQRLDSLTALLNDHGYSLKPRLPIYPQYDHWLPSHLYKKIQPWRTRLESNSLQISDARGT